MKLIEESIWEHVETDIPASEKLTARLVPIQNKECFYCAVDSEKNRHFLVMLLPFNKDLRDLSSRGVIAVTKELTVNLSNSERYIDVICKESSGHEIFNMVGNDIVEGIIEDKLQPADLIKNVLMKWRKFWGVVPKVLLSKEQIIGLFSEIYFLSEWLSGTNSILESVKRWRGPYAARHDFEWPGKSIEVKGTISGRGPIHVINGLDQLAEPENGMLMLFSLCLKEEHGAINNIVDLIKSFKAKLATDFEALEIFEEALLRVGYSILHEDEYKEFKLRVVEQKLYSVRDNFPRITRKTINPPVGVEKIGYEINLSAFNHLVITDNSKDTCLKSYLV